MTSLGSGKLGSGTLGDPEAPPPPSAIEIPHFSLSFRMGDFGIASVEQDSTEEIEDCIEATLRTPLGSRVEAPEFGIADDTFEQLGSHPTAEAILTAVEGQEPRARLLADVQLEELGTKVVTIKSKEPA